MLNIDWGLMVWTLITFGLAVAILWKYAFGPLQRIMDERRTQIRESLEAAEATRDEAARMLTEYQATLASVRAEAEDILERSRKAGDETKAEIVEEARKQAQRTLDKAQAQIERETRAALTEMKKEVAGLTLAATERVVGKSLDDDDHRRLIDEALESAHLDDLQLGSGR
ncbi:MAG: F0F1 ATP synthase subunit B [Thermoleophilia bacterium]